MDSLIGASSWGTGGASDCPRLSKSRADCAPTPDFEADEAGGRTLNRRMV